MRVFLRLGLWYPKTSVYLSHTLKLNTMTTIKSATIEDYKVDLIRLDVPVMGGYYLVSFAAFDKVVYKDGLCLDAANDMFFESIKNVNHIAREIQAI